MISENKVAMTYAMCRVSLWVACVSAASFCFDAVAWPQELKNRIQVSENGRFLVRNGDQPFFYLGDTAWELFHRTTREESIRYLEDRAKKGFTVIQTVALAEFDGLGTPNAYNHIPLKDNDPAKPNILEGQENDYWDHVDFVVSKANSLGMTVGFLPTWGDKWNKKWGVGPEIFTVENAKSYGIWLGKRYRDADLIWILGGDRPIENDNHRKIIDAMAEGLREGDGGVHLCTFHPSGGSGSAQYFHDSKWLDFNMRQNGHVVEYNDRYSETSTDYRRMPVKPVLDAEPIYEGHPIAFNQKQFGHSLAADVRRPLYWDLFDGAMGHTYGHHSVWQFWTKDRTPINDPLMPWTEAISQRGSDQMQYAKQLLLSRPYLTRVPDSGILVSDRVSTLVPGAGRYRFVATRDEPASYAFIYAPASRKFSVHMDVIQSKRIRAWWFDPRTGKASPIGEFDTAAGEKEFVPPDVGESNDWVLVLDDLEKNYPPPGSK